MGVLALIFLGWIVSQSGRPLLFAGIWALFVLFTGLVLDEAGLAAALMSAVVGFVFAAVYFWLLDRFADQILIWIAILIGLPALMVVARLQLLASTGSG